MGVFPKRTFITFVFSCLKPCWNGYQIIVGKNRCLLKANWPHVVLEHYLTGIPRRLINLRQAAFLWSRLPHSQFIIDCANFFIEICQVLKLKIIKNNFVLFRSAASGQRTRRATWSYGETSKKKSNYSIFYILLFLHAKQPRA